MAWEIELSSKAIAGLDQLDPTQARRIVRFLNDRIAAIKNPRSIGQALRGSDLGSFWKYRVGDYIIIVEIRDREIKIVAVRIGHRRQIYDR
jgi:mRNA interferase RelE/StbE